jgi:hypothetical protein
MWLFSTLLLLLAAGHCDGKLYMGLQGGDGDRDGDRDRVSGGNRGGDRDRDRDRDGGETPSSLAGHVADPAGALLAQYQNGPWSAGGGGAHAHRALTTSVEVTSVLKAVAADGSMGAYFGVSVATNGSITVVGANVQNGKGRLTLLSHLIY